MGELTVHDGDEGDTRGLTETVSGRRIAGSRTTTVEVITTTEGVEVSSPTGDRDNGERDHPV